ncbi:MAG: tRNA (guanosine(46)-N7)-methyltransferase TrmB [Legionellales bacterium RIFCSPHIGHO2_12_FULL_37_14]|nr:MAG: tRNA (guanosine(46)-N7)-methyltransferase TrmB [Legionellales bacterium RIFCSPHIGHO2_12_FULL_37_14]
MQKRSIKSFVLRKGRVSSRQQHGLENLLPIYTLPLTKWDFALIFNRTAPICVEIGFGMGMSLVQMAQENKNINYIGIEVHQAGIGNLAADLYAKEVNNVRIAPYDAVEVFNIAIPDNSLTTIQIFFPDPWPKKRHIKRRLIEPKFINLLVQKLLLNGCLHIATDWEPYAEHCLKYLQQNPNLINTSLHNTYVARPDNRPLTKFELRGTNLGHQVFDLMFVKNDQKKYVDY